MVMTMNNKGSLIVLSGFSGSGKGTIVKELMSRYSQYALSVSMTTRAPREGEKDGEAYFFVSKERFEEEISRGGLLEHARYVDNYYGTPRAYVEEKLGEGRDVILEIEVQGGLQIREKFEEAVLVFVTPPSAKELHRRLTGRGTEDASSVANRIRRAAEEAPFMRDYDYILINDDLDLCVEELHRIVGAEKQKSLRRASFIADIGRELADLSAEL